MAYRILVSAQGPLVFGFWVLGLGVWGLGLTIGDSKLVIIILLKVSQISQSGIRGYEELETLQEAGRGRGHMGSILKFLIGTKVVTLQWLVCRNWTH